MKIYTRTGDEGETGLFGGGRVPKHHDRVAAYGAVDELNAMLGEARLSVADAWIESRLDPIQHDLFAIGATLAAPAREGRTHCATSSFPVGPPARPGFMYVGPYVAGRSERSAASRSRRGWKRSCYST